MNLKIVGALSALVLLSACAQKKAETAAATGTGNTVAAPSIAPGSEEDLAKNVGDRVFFAFNKSSLNSDDKGTLDRQAAWLAKYPNVNVQVAGNCDERGTEEYNIALGQRRANAARDYLVAKGTAKSRITTISYGKDRPQPDALGHTEADWAKNRNAITSVK
ncbi:MAG: peptidoglycan-associated lipoprotein Pal [Rhodospirillales bacterium]|nr:peptidoglycan-associated lipoprotein Pal [Rhodospirillales bacterium]